MDELQIPEGATFRIQLATFEGPLDLLLHLIKKHELNILDLPIAFVTERYLDYLQMMQELDLDVASEYLLMAATLAHIKSKMLLPQNPLDEVEEQDDDYLADPRGELIRRLLEYQKYRAAAEQLGARPIVGRDVFGRGVQAEEAQGPAPLAPIDLYKLLDAFGAILKRVQGRVALEVTAERITIHERISEISELLRSKRSCLFEELFAKDRTRYEVVVTFLALLEMTKLRMTRIYQADPSAPLHVQYALLDADSDGAPVSEPPAEHHDAGVEHTGTTNLEAAFAQEADAESLHDLAATQDHEADALTELEVDALAELEVDALAELEVDALAELEVDALAELEVDALAELEADDESLHDASAIQAHEADALTELEADALTEHEVDGLRQREADSLAEPEADDEPQRDAAATPELDVDGLTERETDAFAELHAQAIREFTDEHEAPTAEHDVVPLANATFAGTDSNSDEFPAAATETSRETETTADPLAETAASADAFAESAADADAFSAAEADAFAETEAAAFAETLAGGNLDAAPTAEHEAPTAEFDALPLANAAASELAVAAVAHPPSVDDATTAPDSNDPDSGEEPPAGERETPA